MITFHLQLGEAAPRGFSDDLGDKPVQDSVVWPTKGSLVDHTSSENTHRPELVHHVER